MSDVPIALLLNHVNSLTRDVADMREGHIRLFRILTRSVDGLGREVAGLREDMAGLRREMASLASEQASLAMRVEEAFSRAVRTDIRLDDLRDDVRPGDAV